MNGLALAGRRRRPAERTTWRIGRPYVVRELVVALVVRGHGHDRAGAVLHQHVVGDPDRDRLAVDGIDHVRPVKTPVFSFSSARSTSDRAAVRRT